MARRKTEPESVQAKQSLAERLRKLRTELFGERGGPELARRLGLPVRTWYNYESGVTVPAEVVLKLIEMTSVEPAWLLRGQGPQFRNYQATLPPSEQFSSQNVGEMLRTVVDILERKHSESSTRPTSSPSKNGWTVRDEFADRWSSPPPSPSENGSKGTLLASSLSSEVQTEKSACIRNNGDAMLPIVADGASVAYSQERESANDLDGKLVVAWINGTVIVRWFHLCGRYGVLRAENPASDAPQVLVDLEAAPHEACVRRVLWISTPH